jgi:hypothetical protein
MRLLFAYWIMEDAGSAQDLRGYVRVAEALGHEVVLYGRPNALPGFPFSLDIENADAVVFIFEWTTLIRFGDSLDLARILSHAPRDRRFVIDCDGAYNELLAVEGDRNHPDQEEARRWVEVCDRISDRIFQPALEPLRPNAETFLFHGYDRTWERPFDFAAKDHGMVYVGHSKFRWRPMERVLRAVEPIREEVGRIALVGHGWDALPWWAEPMGLVDAFHTDKAYLARLGVEFVGPVPSQEVIPWMARGIFGPVIYRPLFSHLGLVTCRTFETPAAGTVPLLGLDAEYVERVYGKEALELVLPRTGADELVADIVRRPEHYAEVVQAMRRHLARHHSYEARLSELVNIVRGTRRGPIPAGGS